MEKPALATAITEEMILAGLRALDAGFEAYGEREKVCVIYTAMAALRPTSEDYLPADHW